MNDEHDTPPETNPPEIEPADSSAAEDDLRYAPPVEAVDDAQVEADESPSDVQITEAVSVPVTDELDIEGALAAVSTLSDMVAEQEAAEQARLAREALEAELQAERQARVDHPERFYPVPPLVTLYRGQLTSIVPAILLILIGAWLTFTLTTTKALPDTSILVGLAAGSLALILLARWLASGRWARGSLFFGLTLLFCGVVGIYLMQPTSPGLAQGWPFLVVGLGLSVIVTALLSRPPERRRVLPGIIFIVVGAAGLIVTMNVLSGDLLATAASLWPVALAIILIIWLLPAIFRQRQ